MKTLRAWERSKRIFASVVVLPLAFACGKSESFKALEETKALLSQTDSNAPLLTHPNEQQKLLTEETLILDFNNEKTGNDVDMTYSCFYDQVIDGAVAESTSCDSLPGGAAQKLDPATGKFIWGPLENTSSYELRFSGKNKVGSDTLILTVEVQQNRKPRLDPINDIGIAALKTVSVVPLNKRDPGTATVTYSCRFDKVVDEKISDSVECKNLPGDPAIKFDATSGTLSWVPPESAVGSYEFEIKAENSFGSDLKIFAINVGVSEVKKITLTFIRDQSLVVGDTLSLDINNTITNSDDGVTYTCHYDSLADGVVNELLSCDLLPGTPTQKFNPLTGALNWTPSLTGNTELEVKIKGTKQGDSDNQVFVVSLATQRFGDVGNSAIVFDPTSWDFGSLALNNTSGAKSITITNNASADVYVGSFTSTLSDFIINWNSCPVPPQKLASLATCILNVSFRPTTSGSLGGSIVVRFGKTATATSDYNSVLGLSGRGVGTLVFAGLDSISNITHTSLRLNWTANAAAASYLIFRVNGTALEYIETILNTGGTVNSKTINNLTPSTSYTYRVRATDFVGVVDSNTQNRNATTLANTGPNLSDGPAGWQVYSGRVITAIDINDSSNSIDYDADGDPISYTCHYDNTISGDVNTATASTCASLANIGSGNPTFNQYTGTFSGWKPRVTDETVQFEFKIVGTDTNGASDSVIFSTTVINGAPTITNVTDKVFPSSYLNATDTFEVDFNNIRDSLNNDTDMTYTCVYKKLTTTDSSSASCSGNLPGTFSLSSSTGSFSWLPGNSGAGAYEISVTGTLAVSGTTVGSSTRTFKASVMPTIDDTARLFHIDAQFADAIRGGRNNPSYQSTWRDIADASDTGTLTNFDNTAAWVGNGTPANPMALDFDGSNDFVEFSSGLNNQSNVRFNTWVSTDSSTREKVILSYADSSDKGLTLTNRRLWIGLGNTGSLASHYQQIVLGDNPDIYWRFTDITSAADDSSPNDRDGTKVNPVTGPLSVPQFSNNVDDAIFDLTGAGVSTTGSGYFQTPINGGLYYDLGNNWTIEAWFYYPFPTNCSGGCTLTRGNGGDHQIYVNSSLLLGTYKNAAPATFYSSGFDLTSLDQGWHHVVAVGSGGTSTTFYIDGAQAGSSVAWQSTTDIRSVGNHFGGNQSFGLFDEFAVYPTSFDLATVQEHYQAGYQESCNYVMSPGYWYHLAGIVNDTDHSLRLYLNGSLHCTTTAPTLTGSTEPLRLGRSAQSASTSWAGKISNLMFYSAGDSSEVLADYSASKVQFGNLLPLPPSGLRLWLRADSGLYKDVDATESATSENDDIALWQDLSGNGGHMQVTSGGVDRRPKLKLSVINGQAVIDFDGVEDVLRNLVDYGIPNTVCIVARYSADPASGYRGRVISGSTSSNWLLGWYNSTPTTLGSSGVQDQFHPGSWVHNPNFTADTSWKMYCSDHSSADVQRIFRSNLLLQSNSLGSAGPRGLTLGSHQGSSQWSKSQVAEVIVYNRLLSDSERTALFQYLSDRYGL